MRLAAAAWTTIADVEIVLRNIVAEAIAGHHDAVRANPPHRWYDGPSWFSVGAWWASKTAADIGTAMRRVRDSGPAASSRPAAGKVIAELTLGFWRYLLTSRYEHSLWNPAIRLRFPALSSLSGSDSRKAVYARVEALNYLRNRVAHHEPDLRVLHHSGWQSAGSWRRPSRRDRDDLVEQPERGSVDR